MINIKKTIFFAILVAMSLNQQSGGGNGGASGLSLRPLSVACDNNYSPVCGIDGQTYHNACYLQFYSTTQLDYEGPCNTQRPNCRCSDAIIPDKEVCGADGETYLNQCFLNCAGVQQAYEGRCVDTGPCPCEDTILPGQDVCGNNGKTYANACYLACAGVRPAYVGKCSSIPRPRCLCPVPLIYPPPQFCAKNGNTYSSLCEIRCEKSTQAYPGPCINCAAASCASDDYDPVCGSDRLTHMNICLLVCNSRATFVRKGECPKRPCRVRCSTRGPRVCGVNGIYYRNKCAANCAGFQTTFNNYCQQPYYPRYPIVEFPAEPYGPIILRSSAAGSAPNSDGGSAQNSASRAAQTSPARTAQTSAPRSAASSDSNTTSSPAPQNNQANTNGPRN